MSLNHLYPESRLGKHWKLLSPLMSKITDIGMCSSDPNLHQKDFSLLL